jgi:hypothetical protein
MGRSQAQVTPSRSGCQAERYRSANWRPLELPIYFLGLVRRYCAGAAGAAGAGAGSLYPVLTKSFSSLLGLKNGIFLAGTSTRSPVFGLRPTRGLR